MGYRWNVTPHNCRVDFLEERSMDDLYGQELLQRLKTRTKEKACCMPHRVAVFQAEREVTMETIEKATTVSELRAVLAVMHRKIYS